ncbi:hypothetical protein AB0E67_02980, partial [Streptomyces sp. NPDC032161]|uniref:hypothetical protein n=1 Tax=Streptomyces sp. NPDC032161 TaxID=3155253 RepID=UPI003404B292
AASATFVTAATALVAAPATLVAAATAPVLGGHPGHEAATGVDAALRTALVAASATLVAASATFVAAATAFVAAATAFVAPAATFVASSTAFVTSATTAVAVVVAPATAMVGAVSSVLVAARGRGAGRLCRVPRRGHGVGGGTGDGEGRRDSGRSEQCAGRAHLNTFLPVATAKSDRVSTRCGAVAT